MEGYQIEAFRELKLIERELLTGNDPKLIHKSICAKLSVPNSNSAAIKLVLECLEAYMNDRNIEIPESVNLQSQIEEENKIIQEFISTRAQVHGMNNSEYCKQYGLKYENHQI